MIRAVFGIDIITAYLLVVAVATLLVAVIVWQTHRSGRTVAVWLASSVLGVLLGSIGSYAVMRSMGFEPAVTPPEADKAVATTGSSGMPGMGGPGMGGMSKGGGPGMGGPGMGGMSKGGAPGMGGMGMGMGMGGMARGPQSKRELTSFIRKLDLLTGDIAVTLSPEQTMAVAACLVDVEKPAKMSEDEAKAKHDKLLAIFTPDQKARFEAIGLPRPTGRSGGPGGMPGMGGMGGGMPGMGGPAMGGMGMMGGMGTMGGTAPKQVEDQNPFQQEAEAKALKSVRERLAKSAAAKPAEKPAAPAPAKPAAAPAAPSAPPSPPAAKGQEKPVANDAPKPPAKK